jgi:putative membrane protein
MAGLLYLPRLFVYHCSAELKSVQSETFKVMERRLYNAIMIPAMFGTWFLGIILVTSLGVWHELWMMLKICLLIGLTIVQFVLGEHRKRFECDQNTRTAKYYRVVNEIPTVLMIGIILLAVLRPV